MKKTIILFRSLIVIGLVSLSTSSCKKILDVDPYSYFTSQNFYTTAEEAKMGVLGIYEIMSQDATYGWYIPMVYDNATDIGQISPGTSPEWRSIPHYLGTQENPFFYQTWSAFYAGIDRANVAIEKIPLMDLYLTGTAEQKTELKRLYGEALFLRGFYYSELVRLWGDVPLKIKSSQAGDNLKIGLTDRYEIYTQIIKDMKEAAELLPATLPTDERVSKWAAKAMLARVALFAGGYSLKADGTTQRAANYLEYYTLAKTQIDEVISANAYQLNSSFAQVFKNQCQHILEPTENIFQVAFYNPAINVRANTNNLGYFNAPATTLGVYGSSLNRCFTVRSFYNSFDTIDWRRDFAIATYSIDANGYKNQLWSGKGDESWTVAKWSREYQTNSTLEKTYTHINTVLMRYADVLLMRAEVENELNNGPNAVAYDAINQIRRRAFGADVSGSKIEIKIVAGGSGFTTAPRIEITGGGGTGAAVAVALTSGRIGTVYNLSGGSGYTSLPTVTIIGGGGTGATLQARLITKATALRAELPTGLTKDQFLTAVQNERSWELCFEGMRRADLIRWNLLADKIVETNTKLKAIRSTYTYAAFTNFVKGKHELYPFPQNETDVNKAITRQNPGY